MVKGHTAVAQILNTPQNITTTWTDVGIEYSCFGFNVVGVYVKLTINDSTNFRIRLLGKINSTDIDEYILPINLVTSSNILVSDSFAEIAVNEDKVILLFFGIDSVIPYFKLQVQAGFIGATSAQLTSVSYCLGDR